jgi:hypothetical protein
MLKTRDFSVKGCNNFLSIHVADILNHPATPSLLVAGKSPGAEIGAGKAFVDRNLDEERITSDQAAARHDRIGLGMLPHGSIQSRSDRSSLPAFQSESR